MKQLWAALHVGCNLFGFDAAFVFAAAEVVLCIHCPIGGLALNPGLVYLYVSRTFFVC